MKRYSEFEKELINALKSLQDVPARDPQTVIKARNAFLTEVTKYKQPVTADTNRRLKEWITNLFIRKEPIKMSTLGTIMLVFSLIVGGSSITAASAQDSLPDSILYPLKLFTEELRLGITTNPQEKWELSLEITEQRMEEIRTMLANDTVPSEEAIIRLNSQIRQTIRLASKLTGGQATKALTQTQTQLETQERLMLQTQTKSSECEAAKIRIQQLIRERIRQCQVGSGDPLKLQLQLQQQIQEQLRIQQQTSQPTTKPTQARIGTQSIDPNQFKTPQMPAITRTPMPCTGKGQCKGK
jgi:hypothetical protein